MSKLWDSNCENYLKPWINWFQLYLRTHIERYFSTRFIFAFRKLRKSRNVKNLKNFFGNKAQVCEDKSLGNRKPKLFLGEEGLSLKTSKTEKAWKKLLNSLLLKAVLLWLIGLLFENRAKREPNKKSLCVCPGFFNSYYPSIFRLKWLIKCYPKTWVISSMPWN